MKKLFMVPILAILLLPIWRTRAVNAAPVVMHGSDGFTVVAVVQPAQQGGSGPAGLAAGTPHAVTLYWNAGASVSGVTVSGFNIYRSTTVGGTVGTLPLNGGTPITTTATTCPTVGGLTSPCYTYVDSTVAASTTYQFAANAQSTTGNLSALAPEITVVVPANPTSPAPFQGVGS